MRASFVLALTLIGASSAWAQEPVGCDKFKWPVDRERAALGAASLTKLASGGELPALSSAVVLGLKPASDAKLPSPPERAPKPDTFAGYATIKNISANGIYSVSLSQGGWVDVVQNGKYLKPKTFSGVTGCDSIRKVMKFELSAGETAIQVSGVTQDSVNLVVLPSAD